MYVVHVGLSIEEISESSYICITCKLRICASENSHDFRSCMTTVIRLVYNKQHNSFHSNILIIYLIQYYLLSPFNC